MSEFNPYGPAEAFLGACMLLAFVGLVVVLGIVLVVWGWPS